MPRAAKRAVGRFENLRGGGGGTNSSRKSFNGTDFAYTFQAKSNLKEGRQSTPPLPTSHSSDGPGNCTYHKAPAENS